MDLLLDNPLATMYGPIFLIVYGLVTFAALSSLVILKSELDKTDKLSPPAIPPQPDPFEIAYLRGGINEMARSVIFSLVHKDFVEVSIDDKNGKIKRAANTADPRRLNQIEQTTLRWIGNERLASDVFNSYFGLTKQLEQHAQVYQDQLERRQLLTPQENKHRIKKSSLSAAALIGGLGAFKVLAAIAFGNFNFVFTIILAVVGVAIAVYVGRLPRLTKLGVLYLDRLSLAFDSLKLTSQAPYIRTSETRVIPEASFAGVDPLLLSVGVFGTGILVGTIFDEYNNAFRRAQHQQAGGSGCGSACGSSCSSGGGDGGGSCGSGCGGCGGGD